MIYFDRPGASVLPVDGQIRFFVTPQDTVINGVDTTIFLMVGQQDLTAIDKAGIERASWGSIKALYW